MCGWRVESHIPHDLQKFVLIAAPHTSGWDLFVGLGSRAVLGRKIGFLGKKSLFVPPLGWIMRALGGHPVDRSASHHLVDQVVHMYKGKESFAIALAPEGTRKKVSKFKTGFYHIARGAHVPLILARMDYANKVVQFSEPVYPSGDQDKDMAMIWQHFKGVKGKHPELSIL